MSPLLMFLASGVLGSIIIALCAFIFTHFETRARHWPAFWASALLMSAGLPALAWLLSTVLPWPPVSDIDMQALHGPLTYVEITATRFMETSPLSPIDITDSFTDSLTVLYLIGLVYFSLRLLFGRWQAHKIARTSAPQALDDGRIYKSTTQPVSPFTMTPFGFFSRLRKQEPVIVIPKAFAKDLSHAELDVIYRHEMAHIDRRDDETGLVLRIVLLLFWFNPLCHLFFNHWKHSAEIQCDAAVTQHIAPEMRKLYAETLLKAFHITAARIRQYPTASFSNPRLRNAKMRITNIMNGPTPIFNHIGHKLAVLTAMGVITLSGAALISVTTANASPKTKQPATDSQTAPVTAPKDVKTIKKVNDIDFMVTGRLTSRFGTVRDIFKNGKATAHKGIDIAAPLGTTIYAPAEGVILEATDLYDNKPAYGTVVVLQTQDNTVTLLSHLDQYLVKTGQTVKKGDAIAVLGNSGKSTGPHVHIETHKDGVLIDPMTVWPFQ